jgi:hypothetical protein
MIARCWRVLRLSWWLVMPGFLAVVIGFVRDRACFDRFHLLPGLDTDATLAWPLAATYVLGHCWLAAVYACAVAETGQLLPAPRELRRTLATLWPQTVAMLVVAALEYAPASMWSGLARVAGLCVNTG